MDQNAKEIESGIQMPENIKSTSAEEKVELAQVVIVEGRHEADAEQSLPSAAPVPLSNQAQQIPPTAQSAPKDNHTDTELAEIKVDETDDKEVDMIEKPWVKKAEDVMEKNKGKPFFEEEDHEDLQIEYLKKRFGKEIEKSEDS